jgi:hypothetical protein
MDTTRFKLRAGDVLRARGAGEISLLFMEVSRRRDAARALWAGKWRGAEFLALGTCGQRFGQPVADCRGFGGFRGIDPFMESREGEKRGGAGTMSDMGGRDSGNRAAGGSNKPRTTSE